MSNLITDICILEAKESMIGSGKEAKSVLKITGIFQKGGEVNQNGRLYPTSVLKESVAAAQILVKERRMAGELDHPSSTKINLDRISHLVTKLWMDGPIVYGEAEIIEGTECGQTLAALLRAKMTLGISSRGAGDMRLIEVRDGQEIHEVRPGYQMLTFDAVQDPSVMSARLSMMENKNGRRIMTRESLRTLDPKSALMKELNKFLGTK